MNRFVYVKTGNHSTAPGFSWLSSRVAHRFPTHLASLLIRTSPRLLMSSASSLEEVAS